MLPPLVRGGPVEWMPGSGGGMPITPRNGASETVLPRSSVAVPPSSVHGERASPCANVTPQSRGVTSSIETTSVCPARAPRTSIGPVSAWPLCSSSSRSTKSVSRIPVPARVQRLEAHRVARVDGQHRRQHRREVPVERRLLERDLVDHARGSWIHASAGASSTRRPMRRPSSSRNSQSETACSSPRSSGATSAGT